MHQAKKPTIQQMKNFATRLASRLRKVIPFMLTIPLAQAADIKQDIPFSFDLTSAKARVALAPRHIYFRAPLDETSIWSSGCVYNASSPQGINQLLDVIRASSFNKSSSNKNFAIESAVEISTIGQRHISLFFSDDMADSGPSATVRGHYYDLENGMSFEFETDSNFTAEIRSWAMQQWYFLSPASPSYCRAEVKK